MQTDYYFGSPLVSVAWVAAIAVAVSGAVVVASRRRGLDRAAMVERLRMTWLVAALGAVAILTLQPGPAGFGSALPPIPNPFANTSWYDTVGNVILYLPVGFFAVLVWSGKPRPVAWATGLAFFVSLSIEGAQLLLPIGRSAQTHDVILNTLGGFIGAMAGSLAVQLVHRSDASTSTEARVSD